MFRLLQAGTSRQINVDNQAYLFFSGTDYLGISQHEDFKQLYIEGIQQWGINNGTSRNNNVQLEIYPLAEGCAASRFKAPAALITSSGYMAAQLAVRFFEDKGQVIFSPQTHPALWLNNKPNLQQDFDIWVESTIQEINNATQKDFVIISNAVDNYTPAWLDLSGFGKISPDKNIILIADDSHGIGLTGKDGCGIFQYLPVAPHIKRVVVASMAKGLGIRAGIVLADEDIIADLKNSSMFIGASPPSPASMHAFVKGESIYKTAFTQLQNNVALVQQNLEKYFSFTPDLPILVSGNENLFEQLKDQKIIISSFAYPSANDPLCNRIIITSAHTEQDITTLADCLQKI